MKDEIIARLKTLDPRNNAHWTNDGLPSLKAIGLEGVKRADVTAAAPHFTRDNPNVLTPAEEQKKQEEETRAKAAEIAEKNKPGLMEIKTQRVLHAEDCAKKLDAARKEYVAAIQALDEIVREEENLRTHRDAMKEILDFIKAQREHRAKSLGLG